MTGYLDYGGNTMSINFRESSPKAHDEMEELLLLRKVLWKVRGRRSRTAGTVYLVLSALFLILSYFTRYIVFEIISIIALFLGVTLVLVSFEKYVKLTVAEEALVSAFLPINRLIEDLKLKGKATYIPRGSEVFVFISKENKAKSVLKKLDGAMINEKGLIIPSPSTFLTKFYERELGGNLSDFDLNYFFECFSRIVSDDLKLAEKVEITHDDKRVLLKLYQPLFNRFCEEKSVHSVCKHVGCFVCGSFASLLAKKTKRMISYKECTYDPKEKKTIVKLVLGPSIHRENSSKPEEQV